MGALLARRRRACCWCCCTQVDVAGAFGAAENSLNSSLHVASGQAVAATTAEAVGGNEKGGIAAARPLASRVFPLRQGPPAIACAPLSRRCVRSVAAVEAPTPVAHLLNGRGRVGTGWGGRGINGKKARRRRIFLGAGAKEAAGRTRRRGNAAGDHDSEWQRAVAAAAEGTS